MTEQRGIAIDRDKVLAEYPTATKERRQQIDHFLAVLSARANDDPYGFADFYFVIHGKRMPHHAFCEWVIPMYWAAGKISTEEVARYYSKYPEYQHIIDDIKEQFDDVGQIPRGIVVEAFRGSTKTTTVTATFCAFRIGHEPHKSNLLIQVGDDSASKNTQTIAGMIENNKGWKEVFPHVVPDRELGWGAGGYEVKVIVDIYTGDEIDYSDWRSINSKRIDPTLLGVGYKSRQLIGKHPSGLLVIDDIHDENNTSSRREQEKVRQILTGTIFPTMTPETWKVFIGTPWNENDTLHYVAATGEFLHVKTPVIRDEKLTWEEMFPQKEIDRRKRISGSREFARMYMLDLSFAKNRVFRYMTYPSSEIKFNLPMAGGVDFAGTMDEYTNKAGRNDYFAMAYGAKLPGYGAVIVDGVLEHCTQAQGEMHVKNAQEIFPMWQQSVVEGDGTGEGFIQTLKRNPGLRIIPLKTRGRGKGRRLEGEMAPWLENGTVRISDAETPFLNELRHELDTYPDCENDDALDAMYWLLRGMPDVLVMKEDENELPAPEIANRRRKQPSPFMAFGRT